MTNSWQISRSPRTSNSLSEDFFIELERALKTVERALPQALASKNRARDVLIEKYKTKVIPNLVDLRYIPKVARASRVSADEERAVSVLQNLFKPNSYSPKEAYEQSVSSAYTERDLIGRIESIVERLEALDLRSLEPDFRTSLKALLERLVALLAELS